MNKKNLIEFENRIKKLFESGKLPYPIHFSGGNEKQLIEIFKEIKKEDWVFSTHRSHYHYLLKGGSPRKLGVKILTGKSISIFDKKLKFFSSAIVSGCCAIAVGVAWALKRKGSKKKVWCFVGDGAEDEGHFYEAVRYAEGWDLPVTFIIEDNDRSVETPKKERYNKDMDWGFKCVKRYYYEPTYPHCQTGKIVETYM